MKNRFAALVIAIGLVTSQAVLAVETPQGVHFTVPPYFSQPVKAGLNAYCLDYTSNGAPKMDIMVFTATAEERTSFDQQGLNPGSYFATTFLGISSRPTEVNKALVGDRGGRHLVYQSSIPSKCRADVFELDLPDGRFLAVALRSYAGVSEEERIKVSESIRTSLKY